MNITLTWPEVMQGALAGVMRQVSALRAKRPDRHGFEGAGWSEHIEGACGELAVAKAMRMFWSSSVDVFKAPDIGDRMQVRMRSRHDYDLIVRDEDADDEVFVLVTGQAPHYVVRGWIVGLDAKQDAYRQTHGNRPAAYFVPASALHPVAVDTEAAT